MQYQGIPGAFAAFMEATRRNALFTQPELFKVEEITITGSKSRPVHKSKRPRGRPRGPRGFVFKVPGFRARDAFDSAGRFLGQAHKDAMGALIDRRARGPRSAVARSFACRGRHAVHFALACTLAGLLRVKGGAL